MCFFTVVYIIIKECKYKSKHNAVFICEIHIHKCVNVKCSIRCMKNQPFLLTIRTKQPHIQVFWSNYKAQPVEALLESQCSSATSCSTRKNTLFVLLQVVGD